MPRIPVVWAGVAAVVAFLAASALREGDRSTAGSAVRAAPAGPVARTVASGFDRPTFAGAAPGDPSGLWVAEQPGRLLRVEHGRRRVALDLRRSVRLGPERGLLGMAFSPGFAIDRRLFVHYSDRRGDTRVAEYRLGAAHEGAPRRLRTLLAVRQPFENHNGGALAFGPDGRLYLGLGDGGGVNDPGDRAQDPRSPLGKLLAADVAAAGRPRWRVVALGLRNPWRLWFDQALGHVWIGDVGQDAREEIDRLRVHRGAPANLGWPVLEGTVRHRGRRLDRATRLVAPVASYTHADGCSVTGGLIYRGAVRSLDGRYVYGDFCSGRIWSLGLGPGAAVGRPRLEPFHVPQLTHIGLDAAGALVLATAAGRIVRVGQAPTSSAA
jgi:glucose/arabinose dehydrogenase